MAAEDFEGAGAEGLAGRPWLLAACACVAAAAACWWAGYADAAFVAATLGVVAWFLNQRAGYKRKREELEHAEEHTTDEPAAAGGRD